MHEALIIFPYQRYQLPPSCISSDWGSDGHTVFIVLHLTSSHKSVNITLLMSFLPFKVFSWDELSLSDISCFNDGCKSIKFTFPPFVEKYCNGTQCYMFKLVQIYVPVNFITTHLAFLHVSIQSTSQGIFQAMVWFDAIIT